MQIPVISLSFDSENFIQKLTELLKEDFSKLRFYYKGKMKIPEDAYNKFREQYLAERIMDHVREGGTRIYVTEKPIYSKGNNYVFGEAEYRGPVIVSSHRLKPEFYDKEPDSDVLMERLRKEIVRQLGQCFGLDNCDNPNCVMVYPNSIKAIDEKGRDFCEECQVEISTQGLPLE